MDTKMVVDLRWSGMSQDELIATVVTANKEETLWMQRLISPVGDPVWVISSQRTIPYDGVLGPQLEEKYQALPELDVANMKRNPKLLSKEIVQKDVHFLDGIVQYDAEQYTGVLYRGLEETVLRYITTEGVFWAWRNGSRLQTYGRIWSKLLENTRHHFGLGI